MKKYIACLKKHSGAGKLLWINVSATTEQEAQKKVSERAKSIGYRVYGGALLDKSYKA